MVRNRRLSAAALKAAAISSSDKQQQEQQQSGRTREKGSSRKDDKSINRMRGVTLVYRQVIECDYGERSGVGSRELVEGELLLEVGHGVLGAVRSGQA